MAAKRQSLGKGLDALLGIPEDAETLQDQAVIDSSQELLAPVSYTHLTLPTICSV